jgi:hypothetical protein
LEGRGHGLIEVLFQHLLEGLRKTTKNKPVRIAGVAAEIQTEHLPNTGLEHYLQTN